MVNIIKFVRLVFIVAIIGVLASLGEAQTADRTAPVTFLGRVPIDKYYSTRTFRMFDSKGFLVRTNGVWLTTDGGQSWKEVFHSGVAGFPGPIDGAWVASTSDLYAISGGQVFESTDLGKTWNVRHLATQSKAEYIAVAGNDKGTWVLSGGDTAIPIAHRDISTVPKYAQDVSSSAQAPRVLVPLIASMADHKDIWTVTSSPKEVGPIDQIAVNEDSALAIGPYVALVTNNRGSTWSSLLADVFDKEEDAYPIGGTIAGDRFWISLKNGDLLVGNTRRTDLIQLWRSKLPLTSLVFVSPCVGVGLNYHRLVETTDGGRTWEPLAEPTSVTALSRSGKILFGVAQDRIFRLDTSHLVASAKCSTE